MITIVMLYKDFPYAIIVLYTIHSVSPLFYYKLQLSFSKLFITTQGGNDWIFTYPASFCLHINFSHKHLHILFINIIFTSEHVVCSRPQKSRTMTDIENTHKTKQEYWITPVLHKTLQKHFVAVQNMCVHN